MAEHKFSTATLLDPASARPLAIGPNNELGVAAPISVTGCLGGQHVKDAGGVGVIPAAQIPDGFTPIPGCDQPGHDNWGNYQYRDGSVMVCIAASYYRINHSGNPTYARFAPNDIDMQFGDVFASRAVAAVAGYALHRAFIDGGEEKPWLLVDKYKCSKSAYGTGYVASSIRNGRPLTCDGGHNPISEISSVSIGDTYASCIEAAKGRDGENGAKNASSMFFCISVQIRSLLSLQSLALAQRANSQAQAAWYDSAMAPAYPRGCNNNALRDSDDTTVVYQSDGYSNCALTGSGVPFARTTHNGQRCGVADLNGLVWEVSIGMTCAATSKSITGATQASPCVLTVAGHGLSTGDIVQITSVGGMTSLNDAHYTITVVDADHVSLNGVDATAKSAYTSGGTLTAGAFYAAKESVRMRDFTSGATPATDHWGSSGIASMMDALAVPLLAALGGAPMSQRYGNGSAQVFSGASSGNAYALTGVGHPMAAAAISSGGDALVGKDQLYQYFRDQLCVISGGYWGSGSYAGVFARNLSHARYYSNSAVGLRCACYPE